MQDVYLSVINTGSQHVAAWPVLHDAARPYAVAEVYKSDWRRIGGVARILSRHESYRGACIACGKRVKARALA